MVAGFVTNDNLPGFDDVRKISKKKIRYNNDNDVDKMLIIDLFTLLLFIICIHCSKDSQRFS